MYQHRSLASWCHSSTSHRGIHQECSLRNNAHTPFYSARRVVLVRLSYRSSFLLFSKRQKCIYLGRCPLGFRFTDNRKKHSINTHSSPPLSAVYHICLTFPRSSLSARSLGRNTQKQMDYPQRATPYFLECEIRYVCQNSRVGFHF